MVEWSVELSPAAMRRLGGEGVVSRVTERAAEACQAVLESEGMAGWEMTLTFVSGQRIRALNRAYRGLDRATDVLSFSQREGGGPEAPPGMPALLGDVVVALPVAARQARAFGHGLEREAAFLAVHGTLHLLGYDHETAQDEATMMGKAEAVLGRLGLVREA